MCDRQKKVTCPFDSSHRILEDRIQVHIVRCRRNYPHLNKVPCPFNVTHILDKCELDHHVTVCPNRASFEHFRHSDVPIGATARMSRNSRENLEGPSTNYAAATAATAAAVTAAAVVTAAAAATAAAVTAASTATAAAALAENEENWDDLPHVSSYNPQNYASQAPILRNLIGASKSKRKRFRERERLRLLGIPKDDEYY